MSKQLFPPGIASSVAAAYWHYGDGTDLNNSFGSKNDFYVITSGTSMGEVRQKYDPFFTVGPPPVEVAGTAWRVIGNLIEFHNLADAEREAGQARFLRIDGTMQLASGLLHGSGVPDSGSGEVGDYYVNTANGDLYNRYTVPATIVGGVIISAAYDTWGSPVANLTGPAGAAGAPGAAGAAGTNGTNGTVASRADVVLTTGLITNGNYETGSFTLAKSYAIVKTTVDQPCRVRLYSTPAQQSADFSRPVGTAPAPGTSHGVIMDMLLDGSGSAPLAFINSPEVYGANADVPVASLAYYTITNLSGGSTTITLTLTTKIEEA